MLTVLCNSSTEEVTIVPEDDKRKLTFSYNNFDIIVKNIFKFWCKEQNSIPGWDSYGFSIRKHPTYRGKEAPWMYMETGKTNISTSGSESYKNFSHEEIRSIIGLYCRLRK